MRVAPDDVALPHEFVTTTSYVPASPVPTGLIDRLDEVAPDMLPPLEMFTPPFRHWYTSVAVPFAALALVCVALIREVPLRTTIHRADEVEVTEEGSSGRSYEEVGSRVQG